MSNNNLNHLLEIAKTIPKKKKRNSKEIRVEEYIEAFELQPGLERVHVDNIYLAYRNWEDGEKLTVTAFFTHFGKRFQKKVRKGQTYYMINKPLEYGVKASRNISDEQEKEDPKK